ncbi:MAG: Mov34/MPN/PAD-1 family protein [Nitrosopumilaceae archaeon]
MIFKHEKLKRKVSLKKDARDGIISYCKMKHPNEAVLILRGKSKKGNITIDGLIIPPFSYTDNTTFAGFPSSFLPLDTSYVGIVHSHPKGSEKPSITDSNDFFGLVSITVKSPYDDADIFAWDSKGDPIEITVV